MRLFVVAKQFTMRRDFVADRYFRLWHLPAELARRGHSVQGFATAYRAGLARDGGGSFEGGGEHRWQAARLAWRWPTELLRQRARARAAGTQAVLATSDVLQLSVGRWLARSLAVPLVVDFYDNYEAYGASALPGAGAALRAAARAAAGTLHVSAPLRDYLVSRYGLAAPAIVLENAVEASAFDAPARAEARAALGLPVHGRLVGTAGALDGSRGIGALYEAFLQLAARRDDVHLVLAGKAGEPQPPAHPRVLRLGTLPPERMPAFWRALDVAAICLRDDVFGRYCYPQKLPEIAAVGTPVVFPRIGVFVAPESAQIGVAAAGTAPADYAAAIEEQLARPRAPAWRPATWPELAVRLERFLEGLIG